ncbi:MAG: pirin family protein [Candidatus Coatesbacteria bacterium]|mgnify:CR=1 FL=1
MRPRKSQPTSDGAGVKLRRAFAFHDVPRFDPFLLLDDFGSDDPADYLAGFPWHPHRGIETVTYILHGAVAHGDSMGNRGVIGDGDVQWMTAGGGIIHQEMPQRSEGRTRGFQLWVNLPAAQKMMEPRYRDVKASSIPAATPAQGVTVKLVSGTVDGTRGPVQDLIVEVEYMEILLDAGATWKRPIPADRNSFAYVISGEVRLAGDTLGPETLAHLADASALEVTAGPAGGRLLFGSGVPIEEPVAWGGPIVMNTQAELDRAFDDLDRGTFIQTQPGEVHRRFYQ